MTCRAKSILKQLISFVMVLYKVKTRNTMRTAVGGWVGELGVGGGGVLAGIIIVTAIVQVMIIYGSEWGWIPHYLFILEVWHILFVPQNSSQRLNYTKRILYICMLKKQPCNPSVSMTWWNRLKHRRAQAERDSNPAEREFLPPPPSLFNLWGLSNLESTGVREGTKEGRYLGEGDGWGQRRRDQRRAWRGTRT